MKVRGPAIKEEYFEQLIDYVGASTEEKTAGRKFRQGKGVIGAAYKERIGKIAVFGSDIEQREKILKEEWNFTEEEIKKGSPDMKSCVAIPILKDPDDPVTVGILYLDSNEKDYFSKFRQEIILNACLGIARFIRFKYRH